MAQAATYPQNIPAILEKHPDIPVYVVHTLQLDRAIAAGTPINGDNAQVAETAARSLRDLQHEHPAITKDVVESAVNRSTVIRSTHAEIQYDHGNGAILALLQAINAKVNQLDATVQRLDATVQRLDANVQQLTDWSATTSQSLAKLEAVVDNSKITRRNQLRHAGQLEWRKKEIPGSGFAHFGRIGRDGAPDDAQELGQAALGSMFPSPPAPFKATYRDINRLMVFYNDDFGIVREDPVDVRREKLVLWLSQEL